jgi:phosphatidylglycerol:prolipoprotein diacylglycerol transferase
VEPVGVIGWPVLDRIPLGPLSISPHGLGIAAGYLAGAVFMVREGRKRGLTEDDIGTILFWALIGAIVGARFFYVAAHFSEFDSFTDMLAIWRGGISLLGGITGAIAFAYPFMRRFGYRFLQVMDSAAIGLAFGIIIGRIGDLVIGDHLGKPTDFVLGWGYRGGSLPGPWQLVPIVNQWQADLPGACELLSREGAVLYQGGCTSPGPELAMGAGVHQTALYDFFIALGLFLFLRWLNRRPRREGVLIMSFAVVYGAGRVLTDFLRIDKEFFGLTGSQWGAILAIVLALLGLLRFARRPLPARAGPEEQPQIAAAATRAALPDDGGPTTEFRPPPEPGPTGTRPP